jgi:hypothetical protein
VAEGVEEVTEVPFEEEGAEATTDHVHHAGIVAPGNILKLVVPSPRKHQAATQEPEDLQTQQQMMTPRMMECLLLIACQMTNPIFMTFSP